MNHKKIGLYGGTFNPFHFGHLNLAFEILEIKNLDEVWLIPTRVSPLRTDEPLIDVQHRLNMLSLALEGISHFKICEIELKRTGPSYTIDTVKEIQKAYPEEIFFLILGEDAVCRFQEWKEIHELSRLIPFLIGSRPGFNLETELKKLFELDRELLQAILKGLVPTKQMEICSTDLRQRLEKRLYCGHLIPAKTLDYIYENQLYFSDNVISRG